MNEQQYALLCETCDDVLRAPDSTLERVAIPWLHVVREHPVFLANYVNLFTPAQCFKEMVRQGWRVLRRRGGWLRQMLMPLYADGSPWLGADVLPGGIDVLFVSHLLNPSQAGQKDDFYFGGLPHEMVHRGYSAMIALINHSGEPAAPLAQKWRGSPMPRVVLSGSLRFSEEAALRRRLKRESLRLRKLVHQEQAGLMRRILLRAAEESLSSGSLMALRTATQIGDLVDRLKPKTIVITHEGHAWERVVFAAARRAFPGVRCIGYQHAALFRLQHAIRRNLAREYNPDHILTAGAISKAQLDYATGLDGIPISVLGSNRTLKETESVRRSAGRSDRTASCNQPACLVLPEGIVSECHLLFEFSLGCAKACPEVQFIWRLHPVMSYEFLAKQNRKLCDLPGNIVLSQAALEEDIALCRWALYRGTTAVVQAVVAGLRPVYLQLPGEMTIDPLYELRGERICIKTVADFQSAIRRDQNGLLMDSEPAFCLAKNYGRDFFHPWNPAVLEAAMMSSRNA